MRLQVTTASGHWRDLIQFQIQDLEQTKAVGLQLAQLAARVDAAVCLRILDSMNVSVLACTATCGWNTPTAAKEHTWVP